MRAAGPMLPRYSVTDLTGPRFRRHKRETARPALAKFKPENVHNIYCLIECLKIHYLNRFYILILDHKIDQ